MGKEIEGGTGILLKDSCRYVDDLRILISIAPDFHCSSDGILDTVSNWLDGMLDENAPGLKLSPDKTEIVPLTGDQRPLIRQSAKMDHIQSAISGGFDARGGEDILNAVEGLIRTQETLRTNDNDEWRFSPVADVKDAAVARFGAARYRTTYRSIRPLLLNGDTLDEVEFGINNARPDGRLREVLTQRELDEDVKAFALGLVQRWINDPSHVRLLRIGLDLWPSPDLLVEVLSLLRPFTEKTRRRKEQKQVAWYCLAEILRAGATETGIVEDPDALLPSGTDLECYRKLLGGEAVRLVALPRSSIPWYLRQQALLFLATCNPVGEIFLRAKPEPEIRHYQQLIRFLRGEGGTVRSRSFATLAVLTRRAFVDRNRAVELTRHRLNSSRYWQIAKRDPSFFLELYESDTAPVQFGDFSAHIRENLCCPLNGLGADTLAKLVLSEPPNNDFRNELFLLRFADAFLEQLKKHKSSPKVITPVQVALKLSDDGTTPDVKKLRFRKNRAKPLDSMYAVPGWCEPGEEWRFQLGFLLRFILSQHADFTRPVRRRESWREAEPSYRPAVSHWYQRLYGLHSGQSAFGDDWLPITDWMERFLLALLRWPGCRPPKRFNWVNQGIDEAKSRVCKRIDFLVRKSGVSTKTLILPMRVMRPPETNAKWPLRICVVQTVIPGVKDIRLRDLALNDRTIRYRHRNHLSTTLAAVKSMLKLRETHKESEGRLDWLILPELAVHPRDVYKHLIPFARAHKTIILSGLTYDEIIRGQPLINSALWVIPELSDAYGLQIRILRQGKLHLAPDEQRRNNHGANKLQGFRPCQWLVGYQWSSAIKDRPVWLTASVCYDATDLCLATDLRQASDILAIPAFNKDVRTFDQMAQALHYHMFQLVVIANNGEYGGSNAYWPLKENHMRQIFHIHGQPQASVTFFEVDEIGEFLNRRKMSMGKGSKWKQPPAGFVGQKK